MTTENGPSPIAELAVFVGLWQMSAPFPGTHWEPYFDLTYTRVPG